MLFRRTEDTDANLVEAVRSGKTQRFAELVSRYRNLVYATVLARVHDPDDADDLAQDTFLAGFRQLDQLEDPHKFGPWLRRIAENGAMNFLRQLEVRERCQPDPSPPVPTPDQQVEQAERHALIWEAVDRLPPEQREVLLLFYMDGSSMRDIAAFLQVSRGTVRSRLQRARERLKKDFEKELREAIQRRRRGKEFTDKVMSALPLLIWRVQPKRQFGGPLGWGLQWGVTALVGLAVLAGMENRWERHRQEAARAAAGMHVRVASLEERVQLADMLRGGGEGGSYSLYGSPELPATAVEAQHAALRKGHGGELVWEFDGQQELQGWRVFPAPGWTGPYRGALPAAVDDGVLRVDLQPLLHEGLIPTIQLVSPELGYDARLFDRVDLRVRVVHPEPVQGRLFVTWTNPLNRVFPGDEPAQYERSRARASRTGGRRKLPPSRFYQGTGEQFVEFTPEWQILSIESLGQSAGSCWTGELVDLRLHILLGNWDEDMEPGPSPTALEIDRIVLRGPHPESLPLPAGVPEGTPGEWLEPGGFYALAQKGICWPILGDLDGDQDLDLLIGWRELHWSSLGGRRGWVTALNDGHGGFAQQSVQVMEDRKHGMSLSRFHGTDVNRDGRLDLVASLGTTAAAWVNEGRDQFRQAQQWDSVILIGVGDLNGDGAPDIAVEPHKRSTLDDPDPPAATHLLVYVNDGSGHFGEGKAWLPEGTSMRGSFHLGDLDANGRPELVQWPSRDQPGGCVRVFAAGLRDSPEIARFLLDRLPGEGRYFISSLPLALGDMDGDRRWDLATPRGALIDHGQQYLGAEVRSAYAGDVPGRLLPRGVHVSRGPVNMVPFIVPQVSDLDHNGVRDLVFLDHNYRRGANLRVMRGRAGQSPVLEGTYPLPGGATGWAAGDLDADGAPDIAVVVDGYEGTGVFVLQNRRGDARIEETR